jgi:hypothetical protein
MSKTPWHEWKEKQAERRTIGKNVSPIDFLRTDTEYAPVEIQESRYSVCNDCDSLTKTTKQCKEWGCFMKLKVKLAEAVCPLNKW